MQELIKKNILGITLARAGSKGIKGKNIQLLNEEPLIAYTISESLKSKYLDDYIVSTDSEEIREIALSYGAEVPFLRPVDLSGDSVSSVDALKHAVLWLENKKNIKYDYVIELMCTNPLKKTIDIDKCIEILHENEADSAIAVHKLDDHHPARIKKIIGGRIVDFCIQEKPESRRQDLQPNAYIRSGSIYALNRDYLVNESRRYGSRKSFAYILPPERAINIDSKLDLMIAEIIIKDNHGK